MAQCIVRHIQAFEHGRVAQEVRDGMALGDAQAALAEAQGSDAAVFAQCLHAGHAHSFLGAAFAQCLHAGHVHRVVWAAFAQCLHGGQAHIFFQAFDDGTLTCRPSTHLFLGAFGDGTLTCRPSTHFFSGHLVMEA
eukprot:1161728-Pelagomonas_calceolata.AAC.3